MTTEASDSTPTGEAQTTTGNNDLVTESLLSWTRDVRYVQQCQELLQQILDPMLPTPEARDEWTKRSWYLSSILYVLLVVAPSGRTLGMQACGLKFPETTNRRRLVGTLLALTIGGFGLDQFTSKKSSLSNNSPESLRGDDRRQRHELLRRQMLQRAATVHHSNQQQQQHQQPIDSQSVLSLQERIMSILRHVSKSVSDSLSLSEGPHSLHTGNAARSTFSVATWILRLHLAQYLVTGKYPTILHRLLGVQHEQQTTTSRVHLRPDSHRLIALLIGIQASATLTRHLLNWWTRKVATYLESKTAPPSLTRRQVFPKNTTATSTMNHHSQSSSSTTTCAICRTERSHPAAPASCGHVFCWNCLLQWVSTVRAQCPLCRAPCRPQDIVPLYHYDHHGHLPPSAPTSTINNQE